MTCGAIKPVTGSTPLVCQREPNHPPPHATLNAGKPVARWA